ncbi:glycosyltransferase [Aestuariirhabdus sp. Z084]|uniref:glycosyltransferase n=1 Tax=Aestuariirhabdus haliotis TaxID=2918751 RepID=UPI00201B42C4|nr:glycosyltransferase [Aestuariirhabdus haliotis]MCL6414683.1 glycosyltransferase [Aestuariirhabdus haliotis]MCL6418615.1 glycosyltransferase [Aestuariirhabdus haliotis]
MNTEQPKLTVMHLIYRLSAGGLENGLVNLINNTQGEGFRHIVVVLSTSTDFQKRLPDDVPVVLLNKSIGNDISLYPRIMKLIKRYSPDVFHTRNLSCIEYQTVAWLARVKRRIHSDHGWDVEDPDGTRFKPALIRRIFKRFTSKYVVLSKQAENYALTRVSVAERDLFRICNGVDTTKFTSDLSVDSNKITVGTVSRLEPIKGVIDIIEVAKELRSRGLTEDEIHFVVVGDGSQRNLMQETISKHNLNGWITLVGECPSPLQWYQNFDLYLLTSYAEGISNTILEAMSCGLPIVATNVGGNPELVQQSCNGYLVNRGDIEGISDNIMRYLTDSKLRNSHSRSSRERAVTKFSIQAMVEKYTQLYREGESSQCVGSQE